MWTCLHSVSVVSDSQIGNPIEVDDEAISLRKLVDDCTVPTVTLCTIDDLQQNNDVTGVSNEGTDTNEMQGTSIDTSENFQMLDGFNTAQSDCMEQIDVLPSMTPSLSNINNKSNLFKSKVVNQGLAIQEMIVKEKNAKPKTKDKQSCECPICGKIISSLKNISEHKKLHSEERSYSCLKCDKKFRRKLHLQRHEDSHNGVKAFSCGICGSNFSSKWYLDAHAVIHTGLKPFECETCKRPFNNKSNLAKHMATHTEIKPYVCNNCGRSYRRSYDLKRHKKIHDKTVKTCSICGSVYKSFLRLQRHVLSNHPNSSPLADGLNENDDNDDDGQIGATDADENSVPVKLGFHDKSLTIDNPFERLPKDTLCINQNISQETESENMVQLEVAGEHSSGQVSSMIGDVKLQDIRLTANDLDPTLINNELSITESQAEVSLDATLSFTDI